MNPRCSHRCRVLQAAALLGMHFAVPDLAVVVR
jgi:hypothetical protein